MLVGDKKIARIAKCNFVCPRLHLLRNSKRDLLANTFLSSRYTIYAPVRCHAPLFGSGANKLEDLPDRGGMYPSFAARANQRSVHGEFASAFHLAFAHQFPASRSRPPEARLANLVCALRLSLQVHTAVILFPLSPRTFSPVISL